MQVNNIINLAYSAPATAASPSAGMVADSAAPKGGLSSFGDIIAEPVSQVSEVVSDALQINDPQSGIIPIPQIYGAANPIIAPQPVAQEYIDLSNDGQISQDVLQNIFGQGVVQNPINNAVAAEGVDVTAPRQTSLLTQAQAQQILEQGNLGETFPLANEISNDADFDDKAFDQQLAALQAANNKSVAKPTDATLSSQVANIAALNPESGVSLADEAKVQQIIENHLNRLDGIADITEQQVEETFQTKMDNAIADNEMLTNNTVSLASMANANKQVSDDFKEFDSSPIDANELKINATKLQDISHSKLEAQIRHLEQSQIALRSPVEQIKVKISQGIELGQDKISIKLHPAELGKVDVEMNVDKEGKTHVRIVADRSETLEYLRRDSNELQKALRDVGMATDEKNLQFSLNQNGQNKEQQNFSNGNLPSNAYKAAADEYSNYVPQSQAEINLAISQGGLNILA